MCNIVGVLANSGLLGDMVGTLSDDPNGFHACVGESCIASKLGQALDGVLERINGGGKVLFKDSRWRWKKTQNKVNNQC